LSIWGVAAPGIVPASYSPTGAITLTAGTEVLGVTTTAALVGLPGRNYVPLIFGMLSFLMGATASASLVIAARFNGGTDFDTQTVDTGLLANNATIAIPVLLIGANVLAAAAGTVGSGAIEITGKAGTTACTLRQVASKLTVVLLAGPDA
jgi:hypothetical protein